MQDYRPGEIVLLSFPFADATRGKRRPALVLLDTGDEDIVVGRVTSQVAQGPFDVELLGMARGRPAAPIDCSSAQGGDAGKASGGAKVGSADGR
jgi:hypothetical protein